MTRHLGIRDAVAAQLTGLAGGRVYENRDQPMTPAIASQILVYRLQSVPERILIGPTAPVDWVTDIRIVIQGRSNGVSSGESIADSVAGGVYAALMANQTLGGLCQLLDPGPLMWDQDEADTAVHVATLDVRITHRTENNVIT